MPLKCNRCGTPANDTGHVMNWCWKCEALFSSIGAVTVDGLKLQVHDYRCSHPGGPLTEIKVAPDTWIQRIGDKWKAESTCRRASWEAQIKLGPDGQPEGIDRTWRSALGRRTA